ncbi:MAG TPA: response regulator [Chloroflexi bacterium]|nr:response regulator [Chloroflexota bacterium]
MAEDNDIMGGLRILIIDDDKHVSLTIRKIIESEGYLVNVAHDGHEALEAMDQSLPDLIILDMRLPSMDGQSLMGMLRSRFGENLSPIIVVSGSTSREDQARALRAGADAFVAKPFRLRQLLHAIEAVLQMPASV